jgi:hypothetical protein
MADQYKRFTLLWAGHMVEVCFQGNWLNTGHWHIELRCPEQLPVTETGYRSHFLATSTSADEVAVRDFVSAWLDTAAQKPS